MICFNIALHASIFTLGSTNPATRAQYIILSQLQHSLILRIYIHVSVYQKFRCVNFLLPFPCHLTWHSVPTLGTQFLHLALNFCPWHSVPMIGTQFLHLALNSCPWHSVPTLSTQFLHLTLSSCKWHSVPAHTN